VARIFHDKDGVLLAQELNMHFHQQQMTAIMHRLEVLRHAGTGEVYY
jgi:hypothetical protein